MRKDQPKNKQARIKILFRICCVLLSFTFLPDTVWSLDTDHKCEQLSHDSLPEHGEKKSCNDSSSECNEEPVDSYLHMIGDNQNGMTNISVKIRDLEVHDLREQVQEIISPPPKNS